VAFELNVSIPCSTVLTVSFQFLQTPLLLAPVRKYPLFTTSTIGVQCGTLALKYGNFNFVGPLD